MSELINYGGDCRTAPATPGLLNIAARKMKLIGVSRKIMPSLKNIWFGKYHFEVAALLRNSLMISSLLTNSEAWHNLTESDIQNSEKVDEGLMSNILGTPSTIPK